MIILYFLVITNYLVIKLQGIYPIPSKGRRFKQGYNSQIDSQHIDSISCCDCNDVRTHISLQVSMLQGNSIKNYLFAIRFSFDVEKRTFNREKFYLAATSTEIMSNLP